MSENDFGIKPTFFCHTSISFQWFPHNTKMSSESLSFCDCISALFKSSSNPANSNGNSNVGFTSQHSGENVKLLEGKNHIGGSGTSILNVPLHQDQVYWELTIKQLPEDGSEVDFRIGVCRKRKSMLEAELGDGENSWALKSTQTTLSFKQGDVIGVAYDQLTGRPKVSFSLNGQPIPTSTLTGLKGLVFPAVTISDGVELVGNFSVEPEDFQFSPPHGFMGIIPPRNLV